MIDTAIDLACAVCGVDFTFSGRTLSNLGLDYMPVEEFRGAVRGHMVS